MFELNIKSFEVFFSNKVNNARNRIRAIQSRGPVFYHFHTFKGDGWHQRLNVDCRVGITVVVGRNTALAVYQNQRRRHTQVSQVYRHLPQSGATVKGCGSRLTA